MIQLSNLDESYIQYGPERDGDIFASSLSNQKAKIASMATDCTITKGLKETLQFFLA